MKENDSGDTPKRYTTEQKIRIVRKGQCAGTTITDFCRQHQISEQSYHRWKAELGMLEVDQAKQLKSLERENERITRADRRDAR